MHDDDPGPRFLDGNAAAGPLADIFAPDVTAVMSTCASCRTVAVLGRHRAYRDAPGLVLRCPTCEQVVLRFAVTGSRARLDLRGSQMLDFAMVADG